MKSSRMVSMLLMLQGVERRSARELARALEVSERTVYRDMEALSASGVPIYAERGANGGIALSEGYRKALTQFGEDEIRALFTSGSNPLIDLGLGVDRDRALQKISGALSDAQRNAALKTSGRIHLDQRRWHQAPQPQEFLSALRRAVWDDQCVTLRYRDRDGKISERCIDPLGLVAKAGVWYLVARSDASLRTFRAERILGVSRLDQSFVRPSDFDLDTYWAKWIADVEESSKRFDVIFALPSSMLDEVSRYWEIHLLTQRPDNADEEVRVRGVFPAREAALHQLMAWGARVRIIEPADFCAEMLTTARAIVAQYERTG